MDIAQKFCNWLNSRIQAVSVDKSEILEQRNMALVIENILITNQIDKNNISGEVLLKLPEVDLKEIMKFFIDLDVETYDSYAEIIRLYQKLTNEHGSVNGASQYEEALKWFEEIATKLTEFLNDYTSENTHDLIDSKDKIELLKKQLTFFDVTGLIKPISSTEMEKLDRIINITNLKPMEKAQLRLYIGKENIRLSLLPAKLKETELATIKKYELIINKLAKKTTKYIVNLQNFISQQELELITNIDDAKLMLIIEGNPSITFPQIIDGLIYILLTKELNHFEEISLENREDINIKETLDKLLANCNQILLLEGREDPRSKKVVEKPNAIPEINEKTENLITTVQNILFEEEGFLENFNPDEYGRYHEALEKIQAIEKAPEYDPAKPKTEEHEMYSLILVLESLRQQLKPFQIIVDKYHEAPEDFNTDYNLQFNKIKEQLEVYEVLRKRIPLQKIKDNNHLVYLTDEKGHALIENYMDAVSTEKAKQIINLIEKMSERNFEGSQKLIEQGNNIIYSVSSKGTILTYISISEADTLILIAADKPKKDTTIIENSLNSHSKKINIAMTNMQTETDILIFKQEQANIRGNLAKRAEILNPSVKEAELKITA